MFNESMSSRFGSHQLTDVAKSTVDVLRDEYTKLGELLDRVLPDGRDKSLALTHLEDSAMRSTRSLSHPNR